MASVSVTKAEVQQPAVAQPALDLNAPTRREFLYYVWGASIVLILGQATAGLIWFSLPRFKAGQFGGIFSFPGTDVPDAGSAPTNIPSGRFWLANVPDQGFVALYGVCTHLGCLPKWVDTNRRFECPCHGSKFELSGLYIEGPAPRSLDRFKTKVTFEDGTVAETNDSGDPIPLNGRRIAQIDVNSGARVRRDGKV